MASGLFTSRAADHQSPGPFTAVLGSFPFLPVIQFFFFLALHAQVVEDYFMQRVLYELGTDLERSLLEVCLPREIACSWQCFTVHQSLSGHLRFQAATLKELRRAHKSYLDAVTKRCFLIEKVRCDVCNPTKI